MIENLKDLERLLKLCRKQGITDIKLGSVEIKFGDLPASERGQAFQEEQPADPYANFPQGELSPTQLMFYSAGGLPEDDPELKQQ